MDNSTKLNLLGALHNRRTGRRAFLRQAGLVGAAAAVAPAAASLLTPSKASAATPPTSDLDILNFALNLEYLEGEFYANAFFGRGFDSLGIAVNGTGTAGATKVKTNPQVNFTNPFIRNYAEEITNDEIAHVRYLRSVLGSYAVARPNINLVDSFNILAAAAGLGSTFDPFASQENFLLGSFIFEDVGVTAYAGASVLLQDPDLIPPAAGILSAEAYHASIVRTTLYSLNFEDPSQFFGQAVNAISDVRDSLDGNLDMDQGITAPDGTANIVPTNQFGIAFARSTRQVLNIVYGGVDAPNGLFFPGGVNGTINK